MKVIQVIYDGIMKKLCSKRSVGNGSSDNDTKKIYSLSPNNYVPHRERLHVKIIKSLMQNTDHMKNSLNPVAILIGGGSATGKTKLREKVIKEQAKTSPIKFLTVDPDDIKIFIPEYQQYKETSPLTAASFVHKESCDIRDRLVLGLIENRISFIYEGTLAKPKKYKNLIRYLIREGYAVHLYISDVPLSMARIRAEERAKITGRSIPTNVIESTHKLVPKTFLAVKDLVDSYHIFDNREDFTLIVSKVMKKKDMYESFLKKSSSS
ncbi:zeta toxin family protein [Bacillus sp. EB600]|uniref:zeta toxin family protein n=1 Tax=Bacillus sp. EB600 TaxID=2806345 RepID=UPI0021090362|nr:zeta toxin family protein [Bacillus sp. EB600]MCQ6279974.1 zeta toxin family protein [Bacillus sp. EB600]